MALCPIRMNGSETMRLRRYKMKWICATTAPWALGAGMLVSFTASAGHDLSVGVSTGPEPVRYAIHDPGNLIPAAPGLAAAMLGLAPRGDTERNAGARRPAAYNIASLAPDPETIGQLPRQDLKQQVQRVPSPPFPEVQRQRKGDPQATITPSLSRSGRLAALKNAGPASGKLLFTRNDRLLPRTILMEGSVEVPALEDIMHFEPAGEENLDGATASNDAEGAMQSRTVTAAGDNTGPDALLPATATAPLFGSARRAAAMPWRRPADARDGGTPVVRRAEALASATPAPPEDTPLEIAAAPVVNDPGQGRSVVAHVNPGRQDYSGLISPDHMAREQRCLAEAVYFEARSEPAAGQAAVAQVVLNRVKSGLYPRSVCGVVYQNRHRHLACQFSFACEGKRLVTNETAAWRQAVQIAKSVYAGQTYLTDVGRATHYHANYVRPHWARKLKKNDVIGRHIFYQLRPGQT